MSRGSSFHGKGCPNCKWFRIYRYHVAEDTLPIDLTRKEIILNRGCTYGWEYHTKQDVEALSMNKHITPMPDGVATSRICSGWTDCGWFERGIFKPFYVTLNLNEEEKKKQMETYDKYNIPYIVEDKEDA